jgi:NADH-quinone oxidoreductase subunit G
MKKSKFLTVNNKKIEINSERNVLEVIRKGNIDLPTFCYYSEMSIYGACRLCMVDIEGRGILPSCSTPPEEGMKIKTNTKEIRNMRKVIVELLLANHKKDCTTCGKSTDCQLQDLARKVGIEDVRFKSIDLDYKVDKSSYSLVRDPNKCVLCGDCVRMCDEVQGIGAIDFVNRGTEAQVLPAFGKDLNMVDCVYCGQCSRVCPTGALTPKSDTEDVWNAINSDDKFVVAQIAPAVRVAIGEAFGIESGVSVTNKIVAALKNIGMNKVFDTSFSADLTVIEEGNEFIERYTSGGTLPLFTSCCPAWVNYVESYHPDNMKNLSTCKSPQQMFGSVCKEELAEEYDIDKKDIVLVSIMPCTAKKFENNREEFEKDNIKEVDYVLTTQELITMIKESGINFNMVEPESFDMPFGFKTGAGVIFANSGGVTEAVLRYASEKISGKKSDNYVYSEVRGESSGIKEAEVTIGDIKLNMAVVSGLRNAKDVLEDINTGKKKCDLVEVMACPGGCISGAGQPISKDKNWKEKRCKGIYENDIMQALHKAQDNPYIKKYEGRHDLLHTSFTKRKKSKIDKISE